MNYGFLKTAAATPKIHVADCDYNAESIIDLITKAHRKGARLIVFPELCITGYTCSDLFLHSTLLKSAENALEKIIDSTKALEIVSLVGLPVPFGEALYNCAAVIYKGEILGLVPKINIPNYSEFYEARHFTSGKNADEVLPVFANRKNVLLNPNTIFCCEELCDFKLAVEICEDLWTASSPSVNLALNGATIIANLSASDDVIGKNEYRTDLIKIQSGKLCCAYVYSDSGFGESTTDLVFSGRNLIAENASVLAASEPFSTGVIYADVDIKRLGGERRRISTFVKPDNGIAVKKVYFSMQITETALERYFPPHPFVPSEKENLDKRCKEILSIQATGLATRLAHTGIKNVVLGLSGGLDSTLALIVCVHAFDMLSLDRKNIHAVTMPCFGTTKRTKSNAQLLAEAYGVSFYDISITDSVRSHFKDINHDESIHDVTYENCQARERTQVLMDLSNKLSALVIGTGDLSELALGWATYNGDHMSMYSVNCSVPKTLVRHLTAFEAQMSTGVLKDVLLDILDTPVSPELLPPDENGKIAQKTEDLVGPYELHDFFLYYFVRFGYSPKKIYHIAKIAFKNTYDEQTILKWLKIFVKRFFAQQFKRSCLPDGPKVGSVTLSPRGDWRMPSDASVKVWLSELDS